MTLPARMEYRNKWIVCWILCFASKRKRARNALCWSSLAGSAQLAAASVICRRIRSPGPNSSFSMQQLLFQIYLTFRVSGLRTMSAPASFLRVRHGHGDCPVQSVQFHQGLSDSGEFQLIWLVFYLVFVRMPVAQRLSFCFATFQSALWNILGQELSGVFATMGNP